MQPVPGAGNLSTLSGMTLEDKPEGVRTSFRLNYFAREIKEDGTHNIYYVYNLGWDSVKFAEK